MADGLCIPGLFASMLKARSSNIVRLHLPSKTGSRLLPREAVQNFNRGDTVRLQTHSQKSGAGDGNRQGASGHDEISLPEDPLEICGTVCDISLTRVLVEVVDKRAVEGLPEVLQQAKTKNLAWRIDIGFSPITYIRMKGALEALAGERRHNSQALDFIVSSHETSEHGETVLQPPGIPEGLSSPALGLNTSQLEALRTVKQSRISLIQGMESCFIPEHPD